MGALRPMPVPQDVEITPVGTIRVAWRDGHLSTFRARALRLKCPCAVCVEEWSGEVKVKDEDIPVNLSVRGASRIGNYALSFTWSDSHSTGIYPYDMLRRLCPCPECAGT